MAQYNGSAIRVQDNGAAIMVQDNGSRLAPKYDGSKILELLAVIESKIGLTKQQIINTIKEKGENKSFIFINGSYLAMGDSRMTLRGQKCDKFYMVLRDAHNDLVDYIETSKVSGGRRKKRNTKKSRRVRRTRRRSTRKH